MADTDAYSATEHFTEDDWTGFARGEGDVMHRARVAQHLEAGCAQCEQTLRLWSVLLSVAEQEAASRPPSSVIDEETRRKPARLARTLGERIATGVALVFDSFRQPELAGVRSAGASPRQLLYKAGRYTIKVQVEPGSASDRLCIVGQILDDEDPAAALRDIAVRAMRGPRTLRRTHTNRMGEFHLEPDATEKLQLCVDVPEIGTFTVESPCSTESMPRGTGGKATGGSGRGKRARPR
jgi:hypothetical protein